MRKLLTLALLLTLTSLVHAQVGPGTYPGNMIIDAQGNIQFKLNTSPPPPTNYVLTLSQTGTGVCSLQGAGTYPAGTSVSYTATPDAASVFVSWSPPPPVVMDSNKSATAICNTKPTPPPSGTVSWSKLASGNGPYGWYFTASLVERVLPGRVWMTWKGLTYFFNPDSAAQGFVQDTAANNIGNRENFGADHVADEGGLQIGAGSSSPPPQPPLDGTIKFDLATHTYGAAIQAGIGGNACLVWDSQLKKLSTFGGWTTRQLRQRPTPNGAWTDPAVSPALPTMSQEGARVTELRCGIDQRTGTLWYLGDDQRLWQRKPTDSGWTEKVTTGTKPPGYAVAQVHEASNTLVAWVGCNDLLDPCTANIGKTYLLDLTSGVWTQPTNSGGPSPAPETKNILVYDRLRSRMYLLIAYDYTEVWEIKLSTSTPPPITTGFVPKALPTCTSMPGHPFCVGGSKDINYANVAGKLVLGAGDAQNSGQGALYSYDPPNDTWTLWETQCIPATKSPVQMNHPTDRGPMIGDKRGALWNDNAVPFPDQEGQACGSGGAIQRKGLLKRDANGVWTVMGGPSGSIGGGAYDSTADAMISFIQGASCTGTPGTLVSMDLNTLAKTTFPMCVRPDPAWSGATGGWLNPQEPHRAFFAWDDEARKAYVVTRIIRVDAAGNTVEQQMRMFVWSRATGLWSLAAPAPVNFNGFDSSPYNVRVFWSKLRGRVLWPVVKDGPCGTIQQMLLYNPATDTWSEEQIASGMYGNSASFDEASQTLVVAGRVLCPDNAAQTQLWQWR